MSKKALIISTNHWNSPSQVGTHAISNKLAGNGWDVAFISEPISPFHLLKSDRFQIDQRFDIYHSGGITDCDNQIWAYVPFALFTPQNYPFFRSRFVYQYWQKFTFPRLLKLLIKRGFVDVDLLYFDNPMQAFWLDYINCKKSVFRVVDNYSGYQKYSRHSRQQEKRLCEDVDLVLYTASNLKSLVRKYNTKKAIFFPNGVDFNHFNTLPVEPPEEYISIPSPRVVYVGEMRIRFDFELVKYAAKQSPDFSFILIGDDFIAKKFFKNIPNVYVLGPKRYELLPAYLHFADIGMIPYNLQKHSSLINFVNPLKLNQYFAAGLPVVASRGEELVNMKTPAYLYKDADEFIRILIDLQQSSIDRDHLIKFAQNGDWKEKVLELLEELQLN